MISSALVLMVVGMGFVFLFLAIQVWVTKLAAKVGSKYAYLLPEPEKATKKPAAKAASADEGEVVAAIAAALLK